MVRLPAAHFFTPRTTTRRLLHASCSLAMDFGGAAIRRTDRGVGPRRLHKRLRPTITSAGHRLHQGGGGKRCLRRTHPRRTSGHLGTWATCCTFASDWRELLGCIRRLRALLALAFRRHDRHDRLVQRKWPDDSPDFARRPTVHGNWNRGLHKLCATIRRHLDRMGLQLSWAGQHSPAANRNFLPTGRGWRRLCHCPAVRWNSARLGHGKWLCHPTAPPTSECSLAVRFRRRRPRHGTQRHWGSDTLRVVESWPVHCPAIAPRNALYGDGSRLRSQRCAPL
jgi:hypothetical protein